MVGEKWGTLGSVPGGGKGQRTAYDLWGTHEPSEEGEMWGYSSGELSEGEGPEKIPGGQGI